MPPRKLSVYSNNLVVGDFNFVNALYSYRTLVSGQMPQDIQRNFQKAFYVSSTENHVNKNREC